MADSAVSETVLASGTLTDDGGGGGGGGGVDCRSSMLGWSDAASEGDVVTLPRCSATLASSRFSKRCFSSALCVEAIVAKIKLVASCEVYQET